MDDATKTMAVIPFGIDQDSKSEGAHPFIASVACNDLCRAHPDLNIFLTIVVYYTGSFALCGPPEAMPLWTFRQQTIARKTLYLIQILPPSNELSGFRSGREES